MFIFTASILLFYSFLEANGLTAAIHRQFYVMIMMSENLH